MSSFPSGCLGKLPLHGDFIRLNAASREVQDLDTWIQEGIYQAYEELGSRWDSTFDAAPTSRFIFCHPRTKRIVAGLFKPSVDKAGRRYPFLVYTLIEADGLGNDVGYLPWAMDAFLQRATEMADWSNSAINLNAFLSSFRDLSFDEDMAEARKSFAKYVLSHGAGDYWTAIFGAPAQDSRQGGDECRLAAVQLAAWGVDIRPPESAAMRVPLTDSDPADGLPSAEAAFWIELCRRMAGGQQIPTMTMWNRPDGDTPVRLHMAFGALTSRYFLPFVLPGRESNDVSDLSRPGMIDPGLVDRARATFGEVLSEESLKLSDLLQRLPRAKGV